MKKWEAKKKSVDAYNDKLADKQEALMDKANKIWDAIHAKYYQGDDWSGKPYYSKTAEEMSKEYLASGGAEIDAKLESLSKAGKDEPPLPDFPDVFDDSIWKDGLNSETNEVEPKGPSALDNIQKWMQNNLYDRALVGILDTLSKNPVINALSKTGAFAAGDWAIKYAKGDWSPITKSPGPAFDTVIKGVVKNLTKPGELSGTLDDYSKYAYTDSNVDALIKGISSLTLGKFNYDITPNEDGTGYISFHKEKFNFASLSGGEELFTDIGPLSGIPGMQNLANWLVEIGDKKAEQMGYDPRDNEVGIPINIKIKLSKSEMQHYLSGQSETDHGDQVLPLPKEVKGDKSVETSTEPKPWKGTPGVDKYWYEYGGTGSDASYYRWGGGDASVDAGLTPDEVFQRGIAYAETDSRIGAGYEETSEYMRDKFVGPVYKSEPKLINHGLKDGQGLIKNHETGTLKTVGGLDTTTAAVLAKSKKKKKKKIDESLFKKLGKKR